jgi:hypothetical protein
MVDDPLRLLYLPGLVFCSYPENEGFAAAVDVPEAQNAPS